MTFPKKLRKTFNIAIVSLAACLSGCAQANIPYGRGSSIPKPPPLSLPVQTPLWCYHLSPSGVTRVLQKPHNKPVYNIYEVAKQAYEGALTASIHEDCTYNSSKGKLPTGLVPTLPVNKHVGDSYLRRAALQWLMDNASDIKDTNAVVWYYRFSNAYNDVSTGDAKKWPSAFGQAYALRALNKAFEDTSESKYKDLALRAANAYRVSLTEGGFKVPAPGNGWFYEEMPVEPSPFILNGHLVSTVVLLETYKLYKDQTVLMMAKKGLTAAKSLLPRYDLGYWSRYDLNPRKTEIFFRIRPKLMRENSKGIPVQSLSLRDTVHNTTPIHLNLGESSPSPWKGAWRVSGIDWSTTKSIDGRSALIAVDRSKFYERNGIPKGGSSYNSYFITELPTLRFSNNQNIPTFGLELVYKDTEKGSLSVDIRDVRNPVAPTFIQLKTIKLKGDQKWKKVITPVSPTNLAWYVGIDYQKYHVQLLNELFALTGDQFFRDYAMRWQCYIDHAYSYDSMQLVKLPQACYNAKAK